MTCNNSEHQLQFTPDLSKHSLVNLGNGGHVRLQLPQKITIAIVVVKSDSKNHIPWLA